MKKDGKVEVAPPQVDSIVVAVPGAALSAKALAKAAEFGIDVVLMPGWRPAARLVPARYAPPVELWVRQAAAYVKRRVELARRFAQGKLENQSALLRHYAKMHRDAKLAKAAEEVLGYARALNAASSVAEVRQMEAAGARIYWRAYKTLVPPHLGFKKRLKRYDPGPVDPVNAALNLGYGLLKKECWRALHLAGLNPHIGYLHKPRRAQPALVYDLVEEFRPAVDKAVLALARRAPSALLDPAKRLEEMVKTAAALRDDIQRQARSLAAAIRDGLGYVPWSLK
ncbi:CRISPR-associated endonuclease Cas1 [Pyrobaculum sp. 3827-6]|uniref:CRISPR-associated endonuclease Cas1 n=1 Tax=Pyrobaculum sp. 3827-6 TaxID=2983604 RepID=UPI0021DA56DB|nr:CRISPR-associated endonuclease Cas1 [Pyrobaculum sp. 3827-6]MCU7786936.1 CRISPR-associated endonuclease Cas1 [Pyrobaculum sp. 3827-6]